MLRLRFAARSTATLARCRCSSARPSYTAARLLSSVAINDQPEIKGWIAPQPRERTLVEELHRLEHESPWWKAMLLRAAGTFSNEQRQAAAGGDMYFLCGKQAAKPEFCDPALGGLDDRYYVRFQVMTLHCWICHVRLRQEPKEHYEALFKEMMEIVWKQVELDLSAKFDMGFLQISKHQKEMQLVWHGTARALDAALDASKAPEESRAELQEVLRKNMCTDADAVPLPNADESSAWLTEYVILQLNELGTLEAADVLSAAVRWKSMDALIEEKQA